MIRVLNIISDTNIGGAGRVLINYLQYTDRTQFDTAVALPRGSLLKAPLEELGTTSTRWTALPTAPMTGRTSRCWKS